MRLRLSWVLGLGVALALSGGCGSRLMMREQVTEFRNPDIAPQSIGMVVVVPADPSGHDLRIAALSHAVFVEEQWPALIRRTNSADQPFVTRSLCNAQYEEGTPGGVAFVTWDRVTLRSCEQSEVAFEVRGGYSGVDVLTRRVIIYLKSVAPDVDAEPETGR